MNANDLDRLRHMLDAAQDALSFIEGRTRDDLRASRLLVSALTRQIEIEIAGDPKATVDRLIRLMFPSGLCPDGA